jgi:flagellar biosynthetic protein FlhB
MSDESDAGEKSEAPSGRRVSKARNEGMVGASSDLSQVVGMIGAFYGLQIVAPRLWNDLLTLFKLILSSRYFSEPLNLYAARHHLIDVLLLILPEMMTLLLIAALAGTFTTLIQTKFNWSWHLLQPKFHMLNPVTGLRRLISVAHLVALAQQILKLCIIAPIAYYAFFDLLPMLSSLMDFPLTGLLPAASTAISTIFWRIMPLLLLLAAIDAGWQKYSTYKKLKMSKHEVKDERKSVEGDESTKKRITQIGMNRIRQKMMQSVPKADVVITNPTHISVALSYSMLPGTAPRVVAKGQGHIALRIREIAKEHGVPIVEKKPLARALYKAVKVGHEIPFELFQSVAEVLAYVYRIKGKNPLKNRKKASAAKPAVATPQRP